MFEIVTEIVEVYDEEQEELVDEKSFSLFKDGIEYGEVTIFEVEDVFKIIPSTIEMGEKLLNFSLFQFPPNSSLAIRIRESWNGFSFAIRIPESFSNRSDRELQIVLTPKLKSWDRAYSFEDFSEFFKSIVVEEAKSGEGRRQKRFGYSFTEEIKVGYDHTFSFEPLSKELKIYIEDIERLYEKTFSLIKDKSTETQISAVFDFPPTVKIACGQYLHYFVQFLQDLGIKATSDLKEETGKVLFSVTPIDNIEALDNIREALTYYLQLPSSPLVKSEDSFAIQRLEYEVEALRFKIRAAQRELRMSLREVEHQDLLLQEKNAIIVNQQELLNERVMLNSVTNVEDKSVESEKKVFGLTKIKKLADYGVEIDLGELFKLLKKKASPDEDK